MKSKKHIEAHRILSGLARKVVGKQTDPVELAGEIGALFGDGSLGFAHLDHSRKSRCGFPEFIFGEGKKLEHMERIVREIVKSGNPVLVTRLEADKGKWLKRKFPKGEYDSLGRVFRYEPQAIDRKGLVLIVTAGTTDLPVALEAKHAAELCGCNVELKADAGVAGIHRIISNLQQLRKADVIIAVAGMEGALPSVVGGLVSCPVIAVPTSVGYGTSFKGVTAMLAMLNSCASGVTVVNIDNGFGAGCAAARIIGRMHTAK